MISWLKRLTGALLTASVLLILLGGSLLTLTLDSHAAPPTSTIPLATPSPLPFDLVSKNNEKDLNGLLKNPQWGWQITHAFDAPPLNFPDPNGSFCPKKDFSGKTCTSPGQVSGIDVPFLTFPVCIFGGNPPNRVNGHVNWTAVTYTGFISWSEKSLDTDYCFNFTPDGGGGLTRANHPCDEDHAAGCIPKHIHVEFDPRSTIDTFRSPLWQQIRQRVKDKKDALKEDNADPGVRRAVITGLVNLDSEHTGYTELHPVYVIAIQTNASPDNNTWLIFVRNWGNEGFCSKNDHPLNRLNLRLVLPAPEGIRPSGVEMVSTGTLPSQFFSVPATSCPTLMNRDIVFDSDKGVIINFRLPVIHAPRPFKGPIIHGEVHLKWSSEVALGFQKVLYEPPPLVSQTPVQSTASDEAFDRELEALVGRKVTPSERQRIIERMESRENQSNVLTLSGPNITACSALSGAIPSGSMAVPQQRQQRSIVRSVANPDVTNENKKALADICAVVGNVPYLRNGRRANYCADFRVSRGRSRRRR